MAYASVQIVGEVVKDPGFHVFVDAGVGLAAGVGFSGGLSLGLRDFRRFYGRAVDRTIGTVTEGLSASLIVDHATLVPIVKAMAPIAATALRVAFEIGSYIAKNNPGNTKQDAFHLANHSVGIVLEEAQRFLFERFIEAALTTFQRLVEREVPTLGRGVWDGLLPQRRALADSLRAMPAEPFQATSDNATYWADLIGKAANLVAGLPSSASAEVTQGLAILYAATELLRKAVTDKVNRGEAYAFAIGAGRVSVPPPAYEGNLAAQPAPPRRTNQQRPRSCERAQDYLRRSSATSQVTSRFNCCAASCRTSTTIFPSFSNQRSLTT
jgi:hypothetical protein